jgi:hypothetical protein
MRVFMVKIADSEHLKRITGRITSVSNFIEASKKFKIKYHNSRVFAENFETHQRSNNKN